MDRDRYAIAALIALLLTAASGCNQSFEMRVSDLQRVPAPAGRNKAHATVRDWLAGTHEELRPLLPWLSRRALLTADLVSDDGQAADVSRHFWIKPAYLRTIWGNFRGMINTMQGTASDFSIDNVPEAWPGFEQVWIPTFRDVELSARLGLSYENGKVRDAACVIILPGIFGDNSVIRTRDLALALVRSGIHALAIELRGHGQTEARYPDTTYTFGLLESVDLLAVDDWLLRRNEINKTGLVGYCWGANTALMAAWLDGRAADDADIGPTIRDFIPEPNGTRHFEAGVIAFSPVLNFEQVIDKTDTWNHPAVDPVLYTLQAAIRTRMEYKQWGPQFHSLRRLVDQEFAHSELGMSAAKWRDVARFLRLAPYRDKPFTAKLNVSRVPTLIVHGCNDPLIPAQFVADFVAHTDNPNVAAIVLPGGGHVGFAPWARAYYYSLIVNFFDPHDGPARYARDPSAGTDAPSVADRRSNESTAGR